MPPLEVQIVNQFQRRRRALLKAKRLTSMLQGTMALEGQGLDKRTLRAMTKQSARELLNAGR